jgi:endonuclease III
MLINRNSYTATNLIFQLAQNCLSHLKDMAPRLSARLAAKENAQIEEAIARSTAAGSTSDLSNLNTTSEAEAQDIDAPIPEATDDIVRGMSQNRRIVPRRLAATKAAGRYALDSDMLGDDVEEGSVVQTPRRTLAKRKRVVKSRTITSAEDSDGAVDDESDHHETAKKSDTKRKSTTLATSSQGRSIRSTRSRTDTIIPAAQVFDDDEQDEDFSPTVRRSKADRGNGSRPQEESALTATQVKKERRASRDTKTAQHKTQTRATRASQRGKETVKRRKATESKQSLIVPPDSSKKSAQKKKIVRMIGNFTNKHKVKFGSTPFPKNTRPSKASCRTVFEILKNHHERDDLKLEEDLADETDQSSKDVQGPMHAGKEVTFHAIVKTILSQATNNENALLVETALIHRFRFDFLGVKVKGSAPNYHAMRRASEEVIADALAPGGLHNGKAGKILGCLNHVRRWNLKAATEEQRLQGIFIEESEAVDFVPGMLSLDYMHPMSLQEKFDHLVSMPGIGVKTAACILSFNFGLPVFAVDTHVQRLTRILRWLPRNGLRNVIHAFMHLDKRVPDNLKYGLHQAFWWHGQMCIRCKAGTDKNTKGWNETVCPIEHLVDRSLKHLRKNKKLKPAKGKNANRSVAKKRPNVLPHSKLTQEEATALGYELHSVMVDDGFGVKRANFTGKQLLRWVLKAESPAEDGEDEDEDEDGDGDGDGDSDVVSD